MASALIRIYSARRPFPRSPRIGRGEGPGAPSRRSPLNIQDAASIVPWRFDRPHEPGVPLWTRRGPRSAEAHALADGRMNTRRLKPCRLSAEHQRVRHHLRSSVRGIDTRTPTALFPSPRGRPRVRDLPQNRLAIARDHRWGPAVVPPCLPELRASLPPVERVPQRGLPIRQPRDDREPANGDIASRTTRRLPSRTAFAAGAFAIANSDSSRSTSSQP